MTNFEIARDKIIICSIDILDNLSVEKHVFYLVC